jgi:hypothetical protein
MPPLQILFQLPFYENLRQNQYFFRQKATAYGPFFNRIQVSGHAVTQHTVRQDFGSTCEHVHYPTVQYVVLQYVHFRVAQAEQACPIRRSTAMSYFVFTVQFRNAGGRKSSKVK